PDRAGHEEGDAFRDMGLWPMRAVRARARGPCHVKLVSAETKHLPRRHVGGSSLHISIPFQFTCLSEPAPSRCSVFSRFQAPVLPSLFRRPDACNNFAEAIRTPPESRRSWTGESARAA